MDPSKKEKKGDEIFTSKDETKRGRAKKLP